MTEFLRQTYCLFQLLYKLSMQLFSLCCQLLYPGLHALLLNCPALSLHCHSRTLYCVLCTALENHALSLLITAKVFLINKHAAGSSLVPRIQCRFSHEQHKRQKLTNHPWERDRGYLAQLQNSHLSSDDM